MSFTAIIVAAGRGSRAGGEVPKQWRTLAGKPVVLWSVEALLHAAADRLIVVTAPEDAQRAAQILSPHPMVRIVVGGAERVDSVRAGLWAAEQEGLQTVLIHDAARPFVTAAHVQSVLAALADYDGACPALPVSDTLKQADEAGQVVRTAPRSGLWRAQTPQAFRFAALQRAYALWPTGETPTDDAGVLERAGGRVRLTPGDPMLMKLTYAEDFPMAERLAGAARRICVGQGLDAHRFGPGDHVWLCGLRIPHDRSLVGHSDADAGLHALTDAILGAIGEGDIGDHFPPSDPQWRGTSSARFLEHAVSLVRARGGQVVNTDITLVCEEPRIKPHRAAMRARVAELLGLPPGRVSVKATTMEEMGFTGRREGMAAQAVVTVETPI